MCDLDTSVYNENETDNEHVNSEGLHSIYQSGFRPNHYCETSVFKLTYDIQEAINNKEMVAALFLDMSAAFDTVDYSVY